MLKHVSQCADRRRGCASSRKQQQSISLLGLFFPLLFFLSFFFWSPQEQIESYQLPEPPYWPQLMVDDGTVRAHTHARVFTHIVAAGTTSILWRRCVEAVTSPPATFAGLHSCGVYRETPPRLDCQAVRGRMAARASSRARARSGGFAEVLSKVLKITLEFESVKVPAWLFSQN